MTDNFLQKMEEERRVRQRTDEAGSSSAGPQEEEDGSSCSVCMSRPRTIRNDPCGHAMCCEICTIKLIEGPDVSSFKCPNARCVVTSLVLLPTRGVAEPRLTRMATFQAAPEADATSFASPLEFLQAMLDSEEAEVAEAARAKMQEGAEEEAAEEEDAEEDDGGLAATSSLRGFLSFARDGDAAAITVLLAGDGIDVNSRDWHGNTPLILAAKGGHTAAITALLAAEAIDVNAADDDGNTALMCAAKEGHAAAIRALLGHQGVDANATQTFASDPDEIESGRIIGRTALMLAVHAGHLEAITALLEERDLAPEDVFFLQENNMLVDVNARDSAGYTALDLAMLAENTDAVNALPPGAQRSDSVALMYAARIGDVAMINSLLEEGVDVNEADDRWDRTALFGAIARGHVGAITALCAAGIDANRADLEGNTTIRDSLLCIWRPRIVRANRSKLVIYFTKGAVPRSSRRSLPPAPM